MNRLILLLFLLITACTSSTKQTAVAKSKGVNTSLPLHQIKLPPGFKIEVYAKGLKNARSLALSNSEVLYVGTRSKGKVYAVKAGNKYELAKDLHMPNGVALRNGDLYVAEVNRILKYSDIENNLAAPPSPEVVYDQYPEESHHGWKYIAFGPDDKLYVPVGAPCNICLSENPVFASLTRMNPDGTGFEIVQQGIRNTVGFTWHPTTKELWFSENGRDWMGDDLPACELNHAPKDGMHFGYPFCHQGDTVDPEFNTRACDEFIAPVQNLGPHVAPLGIEFISGSMFPEEYQGHLLIAEHGSWNRSQPIGYRVMLVKLEGNKAVSYEVFAEGWLQGDTPFGRPVDMEFMQDGSLLLSDDYANVVYRIYR